MKLSEALAEVAATVEDVDVAGANAIARVQRHESELSAAFLRALTGAMSQGTDRRYWQTNKLSAKHLRMIQMRAAGYKNTQIAAMLGVNQARVSMVLNQPECKRLVAMIIAYASADVVDIATRLKAVSGPVLETVIDITLTSNDQKLVSKNAFKLLEMAGYGAVEKKQVEVVARIDEQQAAGLTNALRESMELAGDEVEARYEVLASEALGKEATDTESGVPEADEGTVVDSGASATSSPWASLLREPEFDEEEAEPEPESEEEPA